MLDVVSGPAAAVVIVRTIFSAGRNLMSRRGIFLKQLLLFTCDALQTVFYYSNMKDRCTVRALCIEDEYYIFECCLLFIYLRLNKRLL